jgi:predicted MFS family arabinose efflux permease
MASRIGGALSPLLVVPIQQAYGWRMSFYVFGVVGVVWCVVWYGWYRNHPAESPRITASELEEIGTRPPQTHHGLPWKTVLQERNFWLLLLMYHLYCWGGFFYLSWLPTYLQKGREFSEDEMKIWTMLPFVFGACGNLAGGMLSDFLVRHHGLKFGRRLLGATGLGLSALFMFLTSQTGDKMLAVLFLSLGYASMDCMLPVAWAAGLDVGVPGRQRFPVRMHRSDQAAGSGARRCAALRIGPSGLRSSWESIAKNSSFSAVGVPESLLHFLPVGDIPQNLGEAAVVSLGR